MFDRDRDKILTALGKVHQSGVQPMEFCESSVVHANGDFRIMDCEDVISQTRMQVDGPILSRRGITSSERSRL